MAILLSHSVYQLLSGNFFILTHFIFQAGDIIDFHIHTVFGIPIGDKDQVMSCHEAFQFPMAQIAVPGIIALFDGIQSVLLGMIFDFLIIQIITDGIRIAEHIDLSKLCKVYRNIFLLHFTQHFCISHPLQQIQDNVSLIRMIFHHFREKSIRLLIIHQYIFKKTCSLRSVCHIPEIIGHGAQNESSLPPFCFRQIQFLYHGNIGMIKSMTNIHSGFQEAPPIDQFALIRAFLLFAKFLSKLTITP